MPRLVYRGNTIDNFGRFLPAPYIDRIAVFDEYFEITLALFIEAEEDEDEDDILEDLNLGELNYGIIVTAEAELLTLEELKNKELDIFSLVYTAKYLEGKIDPEAITTGDAYWRRPWYGTDSVWGPGTGTAATQMEETNTTTYWAAVREVLGMPLLTPDAPAAMADFNIGEFTQAETTYTEAGKKVLKFVAVTEADERDEFYEFFTNTYFMGSDAESAFGSAKLENWQNINVYAFATTHDLADLTMNDITNLVENPSLLKLNTSAISYEHVIRDGLINTRPEVAWLDKAGEPYDQIPLQSVNSQYYTADNITHADIVAHFEELVSQYQSKAAKPGHSALESALNNISYVLSVYGESSDLLPQLNLLRKTFPSKSTATEVGKLYVRFRKRIYNTNLTVVKERRLIKQLIINPKLVDYRTIPTTGWEWDSDWYFPFADGSGTDVEGEALYDNWSVSIEEIFSVNEDPNYNMLTRGFFFFDYEKVALSSSVSRVFDVLKLQTYFGQSLINRKLAIANVTLWRGPTGGEYASGTDDSFLPDYDASDLDISGEYQMKMTCYSSEPPIYNVPNYVWYEASALDGDDHMPMSSFGSYESYLYPRSFNLPGGGLGDYRLMCYEFQDILEGSGFPVTVSHSEGGTAGYYNWSVADGPSWDYKVEINVEDYTMRIASELIQNYGTEMTNFETYYGAASEACNFNNIDGVFNQFFIDAMENEYGDDLVSAPWVMMPLIFCIHLDLLVNTFNGDYDLTMEAARALSTTVSPYTGTLEAVIGFYNAIISLKDEYYAIWAQLEGLEPGDDHTGWSSYDVDDMSVQVADNIAADNDFPGNDAYENKYTKTFSTEDITVALIDPDVAALSDLEAYASTLYYLTIWDWASDDVDYARTPDDVYGEDTIDSDWVEEEGVWSGGTVPHGWVLSEETVYGDWYSAIHAALTGISDLVDSGSYENSDIAELMENIINIDGATTWAQYYERNDWVHSYAPGSLADPFKILMTYLYPTLRVYSDIDPASVIEDAGFGQWI